MKISEPQYCHICGGMVDDGMHDGMGFTNFWGMIFSLQKIKDETVTISRDRYSREKFTFQLKTQTALKETHFLCRDCADEVSKFVEGRRIQSHLDKVEAGELTP